MWAEGQAGPSQPASLGISGETCQPRPFPYLSPMRSQPCMGSAESRGEDRRVTTAEGEQNTAPCPSQAGKMLLRHLLDPSLGLSTALTHPVLETPPADTC